MEFQNMEDWVKTSGVYSCLPEKDSLNRADPLSHQNRQNKNAQLLQERMHKKDPSARTTGTAFA